MERRLADRGWGGGTAGLAREETVVRIEKQAGVCGGAARVAGTRIPVWQLEQARRWGGDGGGAAGGVSGIAGADVAAALEYAREHKDEMEREMAENEAA